MLKLDNDHRRAKGFGEAMFSWSSNPFHSYYRTTLLPTNLHTNAHSRLTQLSCGVLDFGFSCKHQHSRGSGVVAVRLMYFGVGVRLVYTASPIRASASVSVRKQNPKRIEMVQRRSCSPTAPLPSIPTSVLSLSIWAAKRPKGLLSRPRCRY